jgi:hypothetical protein
VKSQLNKSDTLHATPTPQRSFDDAAINPRKEEEREGERGEGGGWRAYPKSKCTMGFCMKE